MNVINEPVALAGDRLIDGDPMADLALTKNDVMMVFHYGRLTRDERPAVSGSNSVRRPSGRRAPTTLNGD